MESIYLQNRRVNTTINQQKAIINIKNSLKPLNSNQFNSLISCIIFLVKLEKERKNTKTLFWWKNYLKQIEESNFRVIKQCIHNVYITTSTINA